VASETAGAGESRRYHASARRDRRPGPLRPRRADVADIYDQGASAYEALWSPVILPPAAVLGRSLGLRGRCVIADIGAGTGALLGPIGSAAPAARVVALDTSTKMLRIARTRRGVSAVLADALALPLADGTPTRPSSPTSCFTSLTRRGRPPKRPVYCAPAAGLASSPGRGNGSRVPAPCGIRSLPKPACRPPRCAASIPG